MAPSEVPWAVTLHILLLTPSGPALTRMAVASIALPWGAQQRGGDISSLFSARQAKEEHVTPAFGAAVLPRHSHGHHKHKRLQLSVTV